MNRENISAGSKPSVNPKINTATEFTRHLNWAGVNKNDDKSNKKMILFAVEN